MIKSAKIIHKISWRNAIGEYKTQKFAGNLNNPYKFRNNLTNRFLLHNQEKLTP